MRFLALLLTLPLWAADDAMVVRATGEGVVSVKPDQVTLTLGVVTQASTADVAAAQNAKQLTEVLAQLRKDLGEGADIRTAGYSLNPRYTRPVNGNPTVDGYTAANSLLIKLDDLTKTGALIDAATRTGANNVNGIQFGLKNEQASRAQALSLAAKAARANAEAIAGSLGLHVVRVRAAESGDAGRVIPMQRMMMAEARAPTPIESGLIEVHASVTITLEVQ